VTFLLEDGRRCSALLSISALRDSSGSAAGGLGIMMDLSRQTETRKKLEKQVAAHRRTEFLIHESNENEQRQIMQVLHEDVAQRFTGIALLVGVLQKTLSKESHPLATRADELSKLAAKSMSIASELARGYYPVSIEMEGLVVALEMLAQKTESQFNISCKVIRDEVCRFNKEHAIHIYRMVQIVILGAIKHYGSKEFTIELRSLANGGTEMTIAFPVADESQKPWPIREGRFHLIQSRARLINATVEVRDEEIRYVIFTLPGAEPLCDI
jgi:signal transduction histidine kinase